MLLSAWAVFFACIYIVSSNVILYHNGTSVEHVGVPYFFGRNSKYDFEAFNASLVVPRDGMNLTGKAVLGIFPDDRKLYREWVSQGIIGIVEYYETNFDIQIGNANYIKMYGDALKNLGVTIIGQRVFDSVADGTIVTFVNAENVWYETFQSPWLIVAHVFWVITTGISLAVSVIRFAQFVAIDGLRATMPKVAIGIEILGNLLRLLWLIPDPLGYLFIVPGWYVEVFKAYHTVFANMTNLLIVLYWHESMINLKLEATPYLTKLAIPFYGISIFLIALETAFSAARIALFPFPEYVYTLYCTAAFYTIIGTSINIYLSVVVYKLIKRLRQCSQKDESRGMIKRLLLRVTITIVLMGLIGISAMHYIFNRIVDANPVLQIVNWVVVFSMFNLLSITQSMSFIPRRDPHKRRHASKKSSTASCDDSSKDISMKLQNVKSVESRV